MPREIRFFTDEHIARAAVRGLRCRGVDVKTANEAGLLGKDDPLLLELANRERRVIVTQDADFLRLHAAGVQHSGIVYAPQGTSVSRLVRGLLLVYEVLDAEEMEGHIEHI